jgi:hypothetical protein
LDGGRKGSLSNTGSTVGGAAGSIGGGAAGSIGGGAAGSIGGGAAGSIGGGAAGSIGGGAAGSIGGGAAGSIGGSGNGNDQPKRLPSLHQELGRLPQLSVDEATPSSDKVGRLFAIFGNADRKDRKRKDSEEEKPAKPAEEGGGEQGTPSDSATRQTKRKASLASSGRSKHKGKNKHILAILGHSDTSRDILERSDTLKLGSSPGRRKSKRDAKQAAATEDESTDGFSANEHGLIARGKNRKSTRAHKKDQTQDMFAEVRKQAGGVRRSSMGEVGESRRSSMKGAGIGGYGGRGQLQLAKPDRSQNVLAPRNRLANSLRLQLQLAKSKGIRENNTLDFPGRIVNGQKFCIFSFPGVYEKEWNAMTSGEEERLREKLGSPMVGRESRRGIKSKSFRVQDDMLISVACVFFPDAKLDANGHVIEGTGSHFFGKHGTPCNCKKLYSHLACFPEWAQGQAPFGCLWFDSWMNCVKQAHALGQEGVVVYKRGHRKDEKNGLGNSQRGELAWMKEVGIPIVHHWDIDHFSHFVKGAHDEKVWAEAEALAEADAETDTPDK